MKIVNDSQMVRLCITFPSHYPNAAPAFILDSSTTIDTTQRQELLQVSNCYIVNNDSYFSILVATVLA